MPKNPALSSGLTVPNENIKIGHVTSFDPCIDYYEMFSKLYKDILSWYLIKLYVKKISERVARLEVYRQVPRLLPNAAIWKSVTHNCFVHDMLNLLFLLSEIKSIPRIMLFINQSQSVQGHCVHFALSKTRLCKLGPAPRRTGILASIHCSLVTQTPMGPWDLRPAEPSYASRESLGFLT